MSTPDLFQETHRPRPPHVLRAIIEEDTFALSMFGRKGGQVSGPVNGPKNIKFAHAANKERYERKDADRTDTYFSMLEMAEQANEHICPVDPEARPQRQSKHRPMTWDHPKDVP